MAQNETLQRSRPKKSAMKVEDLLRLVQTSLDDGKAIDITTIDLKGKSSIADYMVIASGRSARQVGAISDRVARTVKEAGFGNPNIEGQSQADWVLIDTGDIIVHVFRPEVRDFYGLEKMWSVNLDEEPALN